MDKHHPYISFIIAGRNDAYGSNFLARLQIFVDSLVALWQKYKLDAELLIVEWNPLEDRPFLEGVIIWPKEFTYGSIRIIKVPHNIHSQIHNSDRIPFFEYIAKNVGIRRARGEYILVTNPDIIFSASLIKFFSQGQLSKQYFYRIDRYDVNLVPGEMNNNKDSERAYQKSWFRINSLFGTMSRKEYYLFRLKRLFRPIIHPRGALQDIKSFFLSKFQVEQRLDKLHIHAPGDFLLMSREMWYRLRAYPELGSNDHLDSYMCLLAAAELKQAILPYLIYHQEHSRKEKKQRPAINLDGLAERFKDALKKKEYKLKDFTPNSDNWGGGSINFLEYHIPNAINK